jgi:hypothetical protein
VKGKSGPPCWRASLSPDLEDFQWIPRRVLGELGGIMLPCVIIERKLRPQIIIETFIIIVSMTIDKSSPKKNN